MAMFEPTGDPVNDGKPFPFLEYDALCKRTKQMERSLRQLEALNLLSDEIRDRTELLKLNLWTKHYSILARDYFHNKNYNMCQLYLKVALHIKHNPRLKLLLAFVSYKPNYYKYEILQVDRNATVDDIEQAYERLSSEHHPNNHYPNKMAKAANGVIFQEIDSAYKTLIYKESRLNYDQTCAE